MKNATVAEVRKHLKTLDKKQLEELVVNLYKTHKEVKNSVSSLVLGERYQQELFDEYKKKIQREFDKVYQRVSVRTLKGYLSSFKKESGDNERLYMDLLLYCVEQLAETLSEYNYVDEPMEQSLVRLFKQAIKIAHKEKDIFNLYHDRMKGILENDFLSDYDITSGFDEEYYKIPWISQEEYDQWYYG